MPDNISHPQLSNNSEVTNKTGAEARTKQDKQNRVKEDKFITTYNPALPIINKIIQNNLSILYTDEDMKNFSLSNSLITIYRREKNLKEILSPSLPPPKFNKNETSISNYNKCDSAQ